MRLRNRRKRLALLRLARLFANALLGHVSPILDTNMLQSLLYGRRLKSPGMYDRHLHRGVRPIAAPISYTLAANGR